MSVTPTILYHVAFVHEFGDKARHCHVSTRIALGEFTESVKDLDLEPGGNLRFYELNEKGLELLARSPLHRAFTWLRENGFVYDRIGRRARAGSGFIPYVSTETDEKGRPVATAFICAYGRVYVNRRDSGKVGSVMVLDDKMPK